MKYIEAICVAIIWIYVCGFAVAKGMETPDNTFIITLAIVIGGTLAGGD